MSGKKEFGSVFPEVLLCVCLCFCVCVSVSLCVCLFGHMALRDCSSLTRDQTYAPCIGSVK